MGFFSSLFGGSQSKTPETTKVPVITETKLPAWYENYLQNIVSRGEDVSKTPFEAFGPRTAALTPDQLTAFDLTRQGIGGHQPYFDTAESFLSRAGQPFNQTEFEAYRSPYVEGVVDRIAELGGRNFEEDLQPAINATFTGAGQFGSSRHAEFLNRALRDVNESVLGEQAGALERTYADAMDSYLTGQGLTGDAGSRMTALGIGAQDADLRDAAAMDAIGLTQQQQVQRGIDTEFQDFVEGREYPKTQLDFLSGLTQGAQLPTTIDSEQVITGKPTASPVSQIAGLGTAAVGLAGMFGGKGGGGSIAGGGGSNFTGGVGGDTLGLGFHSGGPVRGIGHSAYDDRANDNPVRAHYTLPPPPMYVESTGQQQGQGQGMNPSSFLNITDYFGGGAEGGEAAGAAAGGEGVGMSNFAGAATPLMYAYLIGKGKTIENERLNENPDDPLGNFGLAMLAPSGAQIAEDPVGMGLPTLLGLPFLTPFTASDDAKKKKPEWSGLFGGLFKDGGPVRGIGHMRTAA